MKPPYDSARIHVSHGSRPQMITYNSAISSCQKAMLWPPVLQLLSCALKVPEHRHQSPVMLWICLKVMKPHATVEKHIFFKL